MSKDAVEILLVQDNPDDEELAITALKRNNLANAIDVARDGEEALEYLKRCGDGPPKVILLDLKLPKVSGLEVLKFIKGNPVTRTIPVVVLTSSREDRDIVESYQLGVNSYIVKPVTFGQFNDSVQRIGMYWLLLNETNAPMAAGP